MPQLGRTVLTRSSAARQRRLALGLVATVVAAAGLLAALVGLVTASSRDTYELRARTAAMEAAAIARGNVASELSRVDAVLQAAAAEIALLRRFGQTADATLNAALDRHRQLLPGAEALRLSDLHGIVRWGNDVAAMPGINVADRDYFEQVRALPGHAVVAGPLQSRLSGHWILVVARPLLVDGRFDGVIYASLSQQHLQQLFSRFDLKEQDAISLRTDDLRLVARHAPGVPAPAPVGSGMVSREFAAAYARDPDGGVYVARTAVDGIERSNAYRRVEGWPLVLVAGLGTERYFAPWREQSRQVAALAFGAWLLVVGALFAAYRVWLRDARRARALAAQTRHTRTLLRVAADGIHILDRQGRLLAMSDSFAAMLGSTPEALLGRPVGCWDAGMDEAQIERLLDDLHEGDRRRMTSRHRRADGTVFDVELQLSVAEIDGELLVFASSRDITEHKRLLAELEDSARRIRDLYDQAPCGYHSLDADGVFVHVNATMLAWLGTTAEALVGRARLTDFVDATDRACFEAYAARLRTEGCADDIELTLRPAGGPPRHVRIASTVVLDAGGGFVSCRSVTQDVTLQQQARREAERLLREQSAMLDNDIVAMVKVRDRRIAWKNRALDRLFGYAPGDLAGAPMRLLYPDDGAFEALGREAYPVLAEGRNFRTQLPMRHKEGHRVWVDLSAVQLSPDLSFWMMVDITALKREHERVEHIAFHDALTALPNRLLLSDRLHQALRAARRDGTTVAICYLDLDGFKQVNDRHGHDAGDALLIEVGHRLQTALRGNDTAARVGGDEFVVVLTQVHGADEVRPVLERLLASLREPVTLPGGLQARVDASIGVSLAPRHGLEPASLLDQADQAMLRAKRQGKGRIEIA